MELSEQIIDNHQHVIHPSDHDRRRMEEAQRRQDRITHNSRVTRPATNSPIRILDKIREMEARKHLVIEIIEKSWNKRDEEVEWTEATFPVRFDGTVNDEQRHTDMPSQMKSLSRLLEMKATRSQA